MKNNNQVWETRTKKFWIANLILAIIMLVAFIFDMYWWIKLITFLIYAICSAGALYCDSLRIEAKIKDKYKVEDEDE
jgi:membrane protein implicated in regulation of membrane protease activity